MTTPPNATPSPTPAHSDGTPPSVPDATAPVAAAAAAKPPVPPIAMPPGSRGPIQTIKNFEVVGDRHEPGSHSRTPLWLWGATFAVLILLATKIYLRSNEPPAQASMLQNQDKILFGKTDVRARALLAMGNSTFTLSDSKAMLQLFDDAQPEELSDLAVVILATHYRLRAVPASLDDIKVVGAGNAVVVEYPGGRPTYLDFDEKYDLKIAIQKRIAEEEGLQLPAPALSLTPGAKIPGATPTPLAPPVSPPAARHSAVPTPDTTVQPVLPVQPQPVPPAPAKIQPVEAVPEPAPAALPDPAPEPEPAPAAVEPAPAP